MPDNSVDILMRIVDSGNTVLPGEAQTQFVVDPRADPLRKDFKAGLFSELRQFSFSAGVESGLLKQSTIDKQKTKEADQTKEQLRRSELTEGQRKAEDDARRLGTGSRLLAAQQKKDNSRGKADFVDMQPVEFTRVMGSSSIRLFKALTESETLSSLSVVKRKAGGTAASGLCYLRLDFSQVLITDLTWKDEHNLMVESGTFIYRKLLIRYAQQNPDGSLKPAIPGEWTMQTKRPETRR